MKILQKAKEFLSFPSLNVSFTLPYEIPKGEKQVSWSLTLRSSTAIHVTSLTLHVLQHAKIPNQKWGRNDIIGKKVIKLTKELPLLHQEKIIFTIPVSRKAAKAVEKKVYHGDMALLNKVSDKAKKTLYHYMLEVRILVKGSKEPIIKSTDINFSEQS